MTNNKTMTYSDDNIGNVVYDYIEQVIDDIIKNDGQPHRKVFDETLQLFIFNRVDYLQFVFRDLRVSTHNPIHYLHVKPMLFTFSENPGLHTLETEVISTAYDNPQLYLDIDIERSDVRRVKKMVATGWGGFGYGRTVDEYTEVETVEGGNVLNPEGVKRKALLELKKHVMPELGAYLNRTTIFINSTGFRPKNL
jgi:hypothetical protein